MNLQLTGKKALVLAASGGLGKATALELAREGATVALCSRSLSRAQATAEEIRAQTGGEVHAIEADVAHKHGIETLMDDAINALGSLDILICNAGGPMPGGFDAQTEDSWQSAFQLTLMSVVRSIEAALPWFRVNGNGSIVVLGSSSIKQPLPNLLLSNVFRPGVHALVKHLASELADSNIRINMVSPGRILTDRIYQLDAERAKRENKTIDAVQAASLAHIPLNRFGDPAEFARTVVFIASPAASYTTGASLLVDGGMVKAL